MAKGNVKTKCSLNNLCAISIELKLLIEDAKYGNDFDALSKKAYEQMWAMLAICVSQIIKGDRTETEDMVLCESLIFVDRALKANSERAGLCTEFFQLLCMLNLKVQLNEDCENLRCKINEAWLKSNTATVPGMALITLEHLFKQINKKVVAADVKRLNSLRTHFTAEMIHEQQVILHNLMKNLAFINIECGQKFLGHVCSLSESLVDSTFKTINFELRDCSKIKAKNYGSIILLLLRNASDDVVPLFKCRMQDMMETFIKVRRKLLELPTHGRNLMIVISCWNVEVHNKTSTNFISMMTECYQPIIWKFLQSPINFERSNAADLLMKAFPLQIPGDPVKNSALFIKQLENIEELMKDPVHIIRLITLTEVCNILSVYWTQFTSSQIRNLLSTIFNDYVNDTSHVQVRKMVWKSMQFLINSEPAFNYLKQLLPDLGKHLNDNNQYVKIEFIKLLIAIQNKKDPTFKFSQIVPSATLFKLLSEENKTVGSLLVELLMPNCYRRGKDSKFWIQKFCWIMTTYPDSMKNFFGYSNKALPLDDAVLVMNELLIHLGDYIRKKIDKDDYSSNDENDSSVGNVSRKSLFDPNKSTIESRIPFENPQIIADILDAVGIIWYNHATQLNQPENVNKLKTIQETLMKYAPSFISYFKGTALFHHVVTLCLNIPRAVIHAIITTLPGYCMKRLLMISKECNNTENYERQVLIIALVSWKRSRTILEQILLWIQEALEVKDESIAVKPGKRVKIGEKIPANPELAIEWLNLMFSKEVTKVDNLIQHREQLLEILRAMEPVKDFVFRRLLQGRPFSDPLLTDSFLENCFKRYVKLILILYQKEPVEGQLFFDSETEVISLVKWARDDILPVLQSDYCPDLPFLFNILNDVLYGVDNIIFIGAPNKEAHTKYVDLLSTIFSMEHKLHFIKEAGRIAKALEISAEMTKLADGDYLWIGLIPKVVCDTFNAIASRPYTSQELSAFKKEFHEVKVNFRYIFKMYTTKVKNHKSTKKDVDNLKLIALRAITAIRTVLIRDIPNEHMQIPTYSSFKQLNLAVGMILSCFCVDFYWTRMFLHILQENLGHTLKILLADLTILHLFAKCKNKQWISKLNSVTVAATNKLIEFKSRRPSGEVHGITISHVEDVEEEMEIPTSQIASAAVLASNTDSGTRESGTDTNMATGMRGSTGIDISDEIAEMRVNEVMDCDNVLSQPSSQPFTQLSQPLSNIATQGSQPTQPIAVPLTPKSAESRKEILDEENLMYDFILVADELLNTIRACANSA